MAATVVQVRLVELIKVTGVQAIVPAEGSTRTIRTVAPVIKPVPVTVTSVPPDAGPFTGRTVLTYAAGLYVYETADVLGCESEFVMTTGAFPADAAGVIQVADVALTYVGLVHVAPPSLTVGDEMKPVPVMVMVAPPAKAPPEGEMLVIVGAAR